jgi:hypothetical protein
VGSGALRKRGVIDIGSLWRARKPSTGHGHDRVRDDPVLCALERKNVAETDDSCLRGAVVCTFDATPHTTRRGSEYEPAVSGLDHVRPHRAREKERTEEVCLHHREPPIVVHFGEARVSQDPGVVHDRVDPSERIQRPLR